MQSQSTQEIWPWFFTDGFKILFCDISSVQTLSRVWLFVTPCTAARQASLSITNSWSLPKLMSIESVMPSSHLILCRPLLLLPWILPSIRVFSNESVFHIRWPKYWSFSFHIRPSNERSGLISFRMDWLDLLSMFFFFFNVFIYLNWRLITLQYCSGLCHTLTWISHGCTCVPHPEPPSHLPPHPIPSLRVISVHQPWAPCLMHRTWTGDLFHIW